MAKKFFSSIVAFLSKWFVPAWAQRNFLTSNPYSFDDLTPVDDIEKGEIYCKTLEWALSNSQIRNIAVTGPYGSGKSSVIKTFAKQHSEFKYLNISLASFREENKEANEENNENHSKANEIIANSVKKLNSDLLNDEHRLVEISILQQMFYKVKARKVPDSRFKRIRRLEWHHLALYVLLILGALLASLILFTPEFLNQFNFWTWLKNDQVFTVRLVAASILILAIVFLSNYFIRFFNSKQFEKLNISSGEIAIQTDSEKSILNKHLDEILYFFEVTDYNVVIIEDLDRFQNHEIFTKLREVNLLLNNSHQINRRVVFIYAIKDDMFQDKTRTKFFDFIVPVIPVVNWSNSVAIMLNKLRNPKLELDIDEHFIRDITLYIDDMRVLKNIFNEFMVYLENLKSLSLNHNKLLAVIIYKNIYPEDFAKLHENKGLIYGALNQLKVLKLNKIDEVNIEIAQIEFEVNKAEESIQKTTLELRAIYILKIAEQVEDTMGIQIEGRRYSLSDALAVNLFTSLKQEKNLRVYTSPGSYTSNVGKSFAEIENLVDPNESFDKRAHYIENKNNQKKSELKTRLATLRQQKNDISSFSLKEFLNIYPDVIDRFNNNLLEKKLLVYLLRFGYIDEMYASLTSYFYEGGVTKNDMDYLLNIKEQRQTDFNFRLTKISEILKSITPLEIKKDFSLNLNLATYLLQNKSSHFDQYNSFFSQFKNKNSRQLDFIYAYFEEGTEQGLFTAAICDHWKGFWETISSNASLPIEKKNKILRLIIISTESDKIDSLDINSCLSNYIASYPGFLLLIPEEEHNDKMKVVMDFLDIKFKDILLSEEVMPLFDYVYINNYYELNSLMISLVLNIKSKERNIEESILKMNYSTILNSKCKKLIEYVDENIDDYITKTFLTIEDNIDEPEDIVKDLLSNDRISINNRISISKKEKVIISNINLIPVDIWPSLFETNKVKPEWKNVLSYFNSVGEIDEILASYINIEANYTLLADYVIETDSQEPNETSTSESFSKELILSSKITDECFGKIINSITEEYDGNLNVDTISEKKILDLIVDHRLVISPANFDELKRANKYPILLLIFNIDEFISNQQEYTLDNKDIIQLLRSSEVIASKKLQIVTNTSEETITGNDELADLICDLLLEANSTEISEEKFKKILLYSRNVRNKIILLINKIATLSKEQVDELLILIGEPYKSISEKGKRPSIEFNQENLELIKKLQEMDYISSFGFEKENSLIRINTKQASAG